MRNVATPVNNRSPPLIGSYYNLNEWRVWSFVRPTPRRQKQPPHLQLHRPGLQLQPRTNPSPSQNFRVQRTDLQPNKRLRNKLAPLKTTDRPFHFTASKSAWIVYPINRSPLPLQHWSDVRSLSRCWPYHNIFFWL